MGLVASRLRDWAGYNPTLRLLRAGHAPPELRQLDTLAIPALTTSSHVVLVVMSVLSTAKRKRAFNTCQHTVPPTVWCGRNKLQNKPPIDADWLKLTAQLVRGKVEMSQSTQVPKLRRNSAYGRFEQNVP